jgi:hypothetical protein
MGQPPSFLYSYFIRTASCPGVFQQNRPVAAVQCTAAVAPLRTLHSADGPDFYLRDTDASISFESLSR